MNIDASVGIFYSGQARTFANCWPNQWWYVLRHFPHAKVFASVADDAQAKDIELLRQHYPKASIEVVKQPDFPDAEKYETINTWGGYIRSAKPVNILRAFWHYEKVWKMAEGQKFDINIRIRPDLWFQEFELPAHVEKWECWVPAWGSWGGINDRFAIMGHAAAERYFNSFNSLEGLLTDGCPFHPETLTRAAVERDGICRIRQQLAATFKIRRLPDQEHYFKEWLVDEPFLDSELYRAILHK